MALKTGRDDRPAGPGSVDDRAAPMRRPANSPGGDLRFSGAGRGEAEMRIDDPAERREAAGAVFAAEEGAAPTQRRTLKLFGREFPLPGSRRGRIVLGVALLAGGILGFLPILGFWMVPLGLLVLSVDSPLVRRWRRRVETRFARWRRSRRSGAK
ncbi:hypothetical protein [Jiella mangrovi]|uniref:hypothetical protein n=1 Tax=Jiella mangrovi TaxID=2821407 RepID=UPI003CC91179